MSGLLARAGRLFVAPSRPVPARAALPPAELVAVLAAPRDLAVVAGGVAAELRRQKGARTALVCGPSAARPFPATPAARRLARRLAERELVAVASGALCHVEAADAREAWRAISAAPGVPAVVALSVRGAEWDGIVAEADRRVLAAPPGAPEHYAQAALASLVALGPAALVDAPAGVLARRRAALGVRRLEPAAVAA